MLGNYILLGRFLGFLLWYVLGDNLDGAAGVVALLINAYLHWNSFSELLHVADDSYVATGFLVE